MRAAEVENVRGQVNVGLCFLNGDGVEKSPYDAVYWLSLAAERGESDAQSYLGHCFANGIGVPIIKSKASNWYARACTSH